jgi:DNA-binding transcriptional MerR regulator/methylmalonyl-CoA mutase cobalamin-binding subunit
MQANLNKMFTQAETENATGFSREVMRKWEARFGFPRPTRDARERRVYTSQDIAQLRKIRQLLAKGHRPRNLLPLSMKELQALDLTENLDTQECLLDSEAVAQVMLTTLSASQPLQALDQFLQLRLKKVGLGLFVQSDLPAMNRVVGAAWEAGELAIHGEHRYTEAVRNLIQASISSLHPAPDAYRVLLTTPPGEIHGLGLLGLQASLALSGAHCISLGLQTPVSNVAKAAFDWDIAVVSISASVCLPTETVRQYVTDLRSQLPNSCQLWLGGQGAGGISPGTIAGVEIVYSFAQAVATWNSLKKAQTESFGLRFTEQG